MKKGQTEIIGLAIVVVLVIIGMTIVVQFYGSREAPSLRTDFLSTQISTNLITSYLHTTSRDCSSKTMTELIQDCAIGGTITCENGQDSCLYSQSTATEILGATLDKWNLPYELRVARQDSASAPPVSMWSSGTACPGNKKSRTFPLPVFVSSSAITILVTLDICG